MARISLARDVIHAGIIYLEGDHEVEQEVADALDARGLLDAERPAWLAPTTKTSLVVGPDGEPEAAPAVVRAPLAPEPTPEAPTGRRGRTLRQTPGAPPPAAPGPDGELQPSTPPPPPTTPGQ